MISSMELMVILGVGVIIYLFSIKNSTKYFSDLGKNLAKAKKTFDEETIDLSSMPMN